MQTTVYLKSAWESSWEWVPYLYAESVTHCISPDVSEATLSFQYGNVTRNAAAWTVYPPTMGEGNFVSVLGHFSDYSTIPLWLGVVEANTDEWWANADYPTGIETLTCYGVERILQHQEINSAITDTGTIERRLKFNTITGRGIQRKANRSEEVGADNVYVFSEDGYPWSCLDIINYILKYFATDATGFTWQVSGEVGALASLYDEFDLNGMTVFDALNELISTKRGLAWRCIPDESANVFFIDVVSILDQPFALGDVTIPANTEQEVVWWEGSLTAEPKIVKTDHSRYDVVRALGDNVMSTASFSITDGTLEPAWTAEMQAEYCAGSVDPGADGEMHDVARTASKFKDVFTKFRVPTDWDGFTVDAIEDVFRNAVPGCDDLGVIYDTIEPDIFTGWQKFEPRLPWPDRSEVADQERLDYEKFSVIMVHPDDYTFHFVDKFDVVDLPAASVELADNELAFWIHPKLNHQYALNVFDDETYDTEIEPEIDYRNIYVTGMFETDVRLQVTIRLPHYGSGTHYKEKVIQCPGLTAHYVVPGTVVDLVDGDFVCYGSTEYPGYEDYLERWDGDRLLAIAAFAAGYYGTARYAVDLTIHEATAAHYPGSMISVALGMSYAQPIHTIVQSRTIDLREQETRVKTSVYDLQFETFIESAL